MRFTRCSLMWLALGSCMGSASLGHAQALAVEDDKLSIYDFMVMNVCTDAAGKVLQDVAPGEPACVRQRNIRAGEDLPYQMHSLMKNSGTSCSMKNGKVAKGNVPVKVGNVTRIVSYYDKGVNHECPNVSADKPKFGKYEFSRADVSSDLKATSAYEEGNSIQWMDDKYGFIMASWSPVALSGWINSDCKAAPDSPRRSYRGWVIGSVRVPTTDGKYFYAAIPTAARNAPDMAALNKSLTKACNDGAFKKALTTWVKVQYTFASGLKTTALVSDHYAQVDEAGTGPGKSMQIERTYWTREFGLTRWEKWATSDWVSKGSDRIAGNADDVTSPQRAVQLYNTTTCNMPYGPEGNVSVTPNLVQGPTSVATRAYKDALGVAQKGQAYVFMQRTANPAKVTEWQMNLCNDYSKPVKFSSGPLNVAPWMRYASDYFWKP